MSVVDPTIVGTEGTVTDGTPEIPAPEVNSDPARTITISVNGVELEVTEDELKSGYMRQQDYTRKTQTVAEQRRELEQAANLYRALNNDPAGTLKLLAQELGVSELAPADDDFADPVTQKVQTLERELGIIRQREVEREIQREIDDLKSTYQVPTDRVEEIMAHAAKNGMDLKAAYRDLNFDVAFEALRAAQARKAAEQVIMEDKTGPAAAVHLGVSSTATGTKPITVTRPKSIKEAYLLAKQGITYVGD